MDKTVVVTGGTRGIGRGLAEHFLRAGCRVAFCGRTEASARETEAELARAWDPARVLGVVADVADYAAVTRLWAMTAERFDRIDIWINNAGVNAPTSPFRERPREEYEKVVQTNLLGVMNGCRVALEGMRDQGGGAIYNMEGLGSRGPVVPGTAAYASSKAAVTRFTQVIAKETAGTTVIVGTLSPGMVITELFTGVDEEEMSERGRRVANILADRVETVAPFLADRVLGNSANGVRIDWLPGWKIAWRFATAAFRKNRLFDLG